MNSFFLKMKKIFTVFMVTLCNSPVFFNVADVTLSDILSTTDFAAQYNVFIAQELQNMKSNVVSLGLETTDFVDQLESTIEKESQLQDKAFGILQSDLRRKSEAAIALDDKEVIILAHQGNAAGSLVYLRLSIEDGQIIASGVSNRHSHDSLTAPTLFTVHRSSETNRAFALSFFQDNQEFFLSLENGQIVPMAFSSLAVDQNLLIFESSSPRSNNLYRTSIEFIGDLEEVELALDLESNKLLGLTDVDSESEFAVLRLNPNKKSIESFAADFFPVDSQVIAQKDLESFINQLDVNRLHFEYRDNFNDYLKSLGELFTYYNVKPSLRNNTVLRNFIFKKLANYVKEIGLESDLSWLALADNRLSIQSGDMISLFVGGMENFISTKLDDQGRLLFTEISPFKDSSFILEESGDSEYPYFLLSDQGYLSLSFGAGSNVEFFYGSQADAVKCKLSFDSGSKIGSLALRLEDSQGTADFAVIMSDSQEKALMPVFDIGGRVLSSNINFYVIKQDSIEQDLFNFSSNDDLSDLETNVVDKLSMLFPEDIPNVFQSLRIFINSFENTEQFSDLIDLVDKEINSKHPSLKNDPILEQLKKMTVKFDIPTGTELHLYIDSSDGRFYLTVFPQPLDLLPPSRVLRFNDQVDLTDLSTRFVFIKGDKNFYNLAAYGQREELRLIKRMSLSNGRVGFGLDREISIDNLSFSNDPEAVFAVYGNTESFWLRSLSVETNSSVARSRSEIGFVGRNYSFESDFYEDRDNYLLDVDYSNRMEKFKDKDKTNNFKSIEIGSSALKDFINNVPISSAHFALVDRIYYLFDKGLLDSLQEDLMVFRDKVLTLKEDTTSWPESTDLNLLEKISINRGLDSEAILETLNFIKYNFLVSRDGRFLIQNTQEIFELLENVFLSELTPVVIPATIEEEQEPEVPQVQFGDIVTGFDLLSDWILDKKLAEIRSLIFDVWFYLYRTEITNDFYQDPILLDNISVSSLRTDLTKDRLAEIRSYLDNSELFADEGPYFERLEDTFSDTLEYQAFMNLRDKISTDLGIAVTQLESLEKPQSTFSEADVEGILSELDQVKFLMGDKKYEDALELLDSVKAKVDYAEEDGTELDSVIKLSVASLHQALSLLSDTNSKSKKVSFPAMSQHSRNSDISRD